MFRFQTRKSVSTSSSSKNSVGNSNGTAGGQGRLMSKNLKSVPKELANRILDTAFEPGYVVFCCLIPFDQKCVHYTMIVKTSIPIFFRRCLFVGI